MNNRDLYIIKLGLSMNSHGHCTIPIR